MTMSMQVQGLPGMRAAKTVLHRVVTRGGPIPDILPMGKMISGACSRDPSNTDDVTSLQAGLLMGKINSVVNSLGTVGYYAPSVMGVTTAAEAPGATSIQASAAVVTELVRRCGASGTFKLVGPGVAGGPVQVETVTYSGASGTDITATAITNHFIAGSFICPTDGSEDPLSFLPSNYPIAVTDRGSGANVDVEWPEVPVGCIVLTANLLPVWPSDASLKEWVASRLSRAGGGKFIFDYVY